ncbi:MAG: response regulator, partial [Desulfatitalea sp.]|nr:response regulator [Desulfatitalea sp.]NNK02146.1 response regulator [Desulfatitalea sp.]
EDHSRIAAWLDTCIASGCGELTPNTYRLIRKNGDILHVRSVGVIHRAPTGSHIVFGTVQDITEQIQAKREQERLQTQLLNAQKMEAIGTLAGGIAHDFNNILTSILGFTELAMEDTKANPLVLEHLNEIFSAGKRAKQLVRQILAFARQADDACRPIRIDTIVKEVLKLLRSSIPVSIDIKQHINSDAMVMGNAIQVYQIMMNLCANAAQAMEDEGGRLEVSLSNTSFNDARARHLNLKSGDYVKLKVSDTGPGIAPEIIDTIFDPYFTTKGPGEGTGMGLAVVHGIVQNYGGTIRADSKPKKGTVFTVYLPAVKGHDISAPPMLEKAPAGIEHILLIDDELPIIKAASEILKRLGYTVTTRSSSPAALELFRSTPGKFDLVITDMTMPDMTGDRLAAELLSIRSNIPVILCTGYSKKMTKERAAEIGIKAFLNKPITRSSLALTVRHVLDQS